MANTVNQSLCALKTLDFLFVIVFLNKKNKIIMRTPTRTLLYSFINITTQCVEKDSEQWLIVKNFLIQNTEFQGSKKNKYLVTHWSVMQSTL